MKMPELHVSLSPRMRKILSYSGYPLFYLLCLAVFAYWTFPYNRLKDRIITEFEASRAAAGSPQRLEIGSLDSYWFSGVRARDVRLTSVPTGADSARPTKIEIDEVHARVSILPLLIGRVSVTFGASAFGGNVSGSMRVTGDRVLDVSAEKLDLSAIGPVVAALGAPLTGSLTATVSLTFAEQKLAKAVGSVECKIDDLSVGDGKTPIQGKIALPKLNVGALTLSSEAKDGVMRISKLAAAGQDLDLAGEGKITLRDSFGDSQSDLYLRFRFSEAYKGRNDMTKSLFGSPGSSLPPLFELADARIKASKRSDGFYSWHMSGLLKDPRFDAAPGGAAGAALGGPAGRLPSIKAP